VATRSTPTPRFLAGPTSIRICRQTDLLSQRQERDQPRVSDQIGVIELDIDRSRGMRRLHLAGASSNSLMNP
jgi:hypothetical protein